jgi:hypothetical protein
VEQCANNILTDDNFTCSSATSCTTFKLMVRSENYQCVLDCPAHFVDFQTMECKETSPCTQTQFSQLISLTTTSKCVDECDSGLVTEEDHTICFVDGTCNSTAFKQLISSSTGYCVLDCQNNIVMSNNLTCSSETTCSTFKLMVRSNTFQCLADCPDGLVALSSSTCIQSCTENQFTQLVSGSTS